MENDSKILDQIMNSKRFFRPLSIQVGQALLNSRRLLKQRFPKHKLAGQNKLLNFLIILGAESLNQLSEDQLKFRILEIEKTDARYNLDLESLQDNPEALQKAYLELKSDTIREAKRAVRRSLKKKGPKELEQLEKSGLDLKKLKKLLEKD